MSNVYFNRLQAPKWDSLEMPSYLLKESKRNIKIAFEQTENQRSLAGRATHLAAGTGLAAAALVAYPLVYLIDWIANVTLSLVDRSSKSQISQDVEFIRSKLCMENYMGELPRHKMIWLEIICDKQANVVGLRGADHWEQWVTEKSKSLENLYIIEIDMSLDSFIKNQEDTKGKVFTKSPEQGNRGLNGQPCSAVPKDVHDKIDGLLDSLNELARGADVVAKERGIEPTTEASRKNPLLVLSQPWYCVLTNTQRFPSQYLMEQAKSYKD